MFCRQAIGLLRRIRFTAQTTVATNCRRNTINDSSAPNTRNMSISCQYVSGFSLWNNKPPGISLWILLYSQAAIFFGMNATTAYADDVPLESVGNDAEESGFSESNIHTSKWRVFTNNGRNLYSKGKLAKAEKYFVLALQEAKEGFGEKDPHVASSCNNLAELYRVQKAFGKAEPFYLEEVKILEESFGPDDIRVGAALHKLGQFYLVQRKLEQARMAYERALKIKRHVLGHAHSDYAETMFHLGSVMYLEGKEKDSVTLIENSIKILEEGGQRESVTCLWRLKMLSMIHLESNSFAEVENIQRKILHIMELSTGWKSLETVIAAMRLSLILQSIGSLQEAGELLQQCLDARKTLLPEYHIQVGAGELLQQYLDARKTLLPEDHIQIGANMLHMARVIILKSEQLVKVDLSEVSRELDRANTILENSIRITRAILDRQTQKKRNVKDEHAALVILLQAFINLGLLEIAKQNLQEARVDCSSVTKAEHAFRQCIYAFNEAAKSKSGRLICNTPDVKAEYVSCLQHLISLKTKVMEGRTQNSREASLQEQKDEIKSVEADLSRN